jgi:hypothetical protein
MKNIAVVCGLWLGCTYGGSNEDPRIEVDRPETISTGVMDASSTVDEPPVQTAVKDASRALVVDASKPRVDAAGIVNTCEPATPIATCDPVRNTGCPPLTQCDVDTGATTPTGRCVFFQASLDSTTCSATFLNESCEAQSTCVGNACRKLCYCDSDCPTGQCCNDSFDPQGVFKLCSPC